MNKKQLEVEEAELKNHIARLSASIDYCFKQEKDYRQEAENFKKQAHGYEEIMQNYMNRLDYITNERGAA
jgi:FtsZ-binding cell division protein ZapB